MLQIGISLQNNNLPQKTRNEEKSGKKPNEVANSIWIQGLWPQSSMEKQQETR